MAAARCAAVKFNQLLALFSPLHLEHTAPPPRRSSVPRRSTLQIPHQTLAATRARAPTFPRRVQGNRARARATILENSLIFVS